MLLHNAGRTGCQPFPKPAPVVLPMSRLAEPEASWQGPLADSVSDLMHYQYRLTVLQWNRGPARRRPTQSLSAACSRFHVVILQEASDHAPHVSDQFRTYTDGNDFAILLNKDTFEAGAAVFSISESSSSKDTRRHVAHVVRGLLRRPSAAGSPTVTFCSVHKQYKVAKKRDADASVPRPQAAAPC